MNSDQLKTNASLFTAFGFALVSTTCCALPIALIALGLGSAFASMTAALPWLGILPHYKAFTFLATGLVLAYCFWRVQKASVCHLKDKRVLFWQRSFLWLSTSIFMVSVVAAYVLLPLTIWWESIS